MPRVLISDTMDNIAEKILLSNNIEVDIITNFTPDELIKNINNYDGTFSESLESYINYTSRFSMGNDISDINNDAYPDIMVLDMLPQDEYVLKSSAGEDSYEIYKMKL